MNIDKPSFQYSCEGDYFLCNGEKHASHEFNSDFTQSGFYIYEVFRVINNVPLFLDDHIARLHQSCILTKNCPGFSVADVKKNVSRLIEWNGIEVGNIKIVVHSVHSQQQIIIFQTPHDYPSAQQYKEGVNVTLFKGIRNNPNAKVMDLALRSATNKTKEYLDVYETLLIDSEQCITEGSRSNVFFIKNNEVYTSPLEDVLPGITRKHIMDLCIKLDIPLKEEKILARSIVIMEACFISGTSRKVLPVAQIDTLNFDCNHPLLRRIQDAFDNLVKKYVAMH